MSELRKISGATHEEIIVGDFVRLASGGPIGIVRQRHVDQVQVLFLTEDRPVIEASYLCFRQASSRQ